MQYRALSWPTEWAVRRVCWSAPGALSFGRYGQRTGGQSTRPGTYNPTMRRLRDDLLDIYWWMVLKEICPCMLFGRWTPDWASLLCHRLDTAWWRYRQGAGG